MDYIFDSYDRNKKYLLTFLVLSIFTVVIYTGRLIDFPKIGVLFFVVLLFPFFFYPREMLGPSLLCLLAAFHLLSLHRF